MVLHRCMKSIIQRKEEDPSSTNMWSTQWHWSIAKAMFIRSFNLIKDICNQQSCFLHEQHEHPFLVSLHCYRLKNVLQRTDPPFFLKAKSLVTTVCAVFTSVCYAYMLVSAQLSKIHPLFPMPHWPFYLTLSREFIFFFSFHKRLFW